MISWFKKIFGIKPKLFRHGDLLIRKVSSIPKTAILLSTSVIAEGEHPDHNHKLSGEHQVFETLDKQLYFQAEDHVLIKHPDHNTLDIPAGQYIIERQRRYNPFENLQEEVLD